VDIPPVHYTTTRDGVSIAFTVLGGGPARVFVFPLIPPITFGGALGDDVMGPIARAYRPDIAKYYFDQRGLGLSGEWVGEATMDDLLLDLEAVVMAAGPPVGLDGGISAEFLTVPFAAAHPEKVRWLTMFRPSLDGASFIARMQRYAPLIDSAPDAFVDVLLRNVSRYAEGTGWSDWSRASRAHASSGAIRRRLDAIAPIELRPLLPLVTCPSVVYTWPGPGRDQSHEFAAHLRCSTLLVLPDAARVTGEATARTWAAIDAAYRQMGLEYGDARPECEEPLSARELEVLSLIAAGRNTREIADLLMVSIRTVESHVDHIYQKTGTHSRAQAAGYAIRHGLDPADRYLPPAVQ
jgi:DNA-binding CsgD family transcriptional regulator